MSPENGKPVPVLRNLEIAVLPSEWTPPKHAELRILHVDEKVSYRQSLQALFHFRGTHESYGDRGLPDHATSSHNQNRGPSRETHTAGHGSVLHSVGCESYHANNATSSKALAVCGPDLPHRGKETLPTIKGLSTNWRRFLTNYNRPANTSDIVNENRQLSVKQQRTSESETARVSDPSLLQPKGHSVHDIAPFTRNVGSEVIPAVVTTITGGDSNTTTTKKQRHRKKAQHTPRYLGSNTIDGDFHTKSHLDMNVAEPNLKAIARAYRVTNVGFDHPIRTSSANNCKSSPWDTGILTTAPQDDSQALPTSGPITERKRAISTYPVVCETEEANTPPHPSEESRKGVQGGPIPDRIELMEMRRNIIQRSIRSVSVAIDQLTRIGSPGLPTCDVEPGESIKISVARLESELAKLRRDEHEIGVNLVRAWKRRDENYFYGAGSTSLWVKRVSN